MLATRCLPWAVALNLEALASDDLVGGVVRGDHDFVCVEGGRGTEIAGPADKSPVGSPSREFQVATDGRGTVDCRIAPTGRGIEAGRGSIVTTRPYLHLAGVNFGRQAD